MDDIKAKIPFFETTDVLARSAMRTDWSHNAYHIDEIHDLGFRGAGVKVAVIDTGVNWMHRCFTDALESGRLEYVDVRKSNASNPDPMDHISGHGTWVASRFLGNGDGILGFAPDVSLLSIKGLGDYGEGNVRDIVTGVELAMEWGADIISTSVGWSGYIKQVDELADRVANKGILWFSASGNDGTDDGVDYPANYRSVISVGSHSKDFARSEFSDMGITLDLYSSGDGVLGAGTGQRVLLMSGTSMATPSLSALVATIHTIIKEKYGTIDRNWIRDFASCKDH